MNKKEYYLKDISIFKDFIKHINNLDNLNYNKENFWHLLLLLSRSYINDNFHKMFELVNTDYLARIFSGTVTREDYFDNTFTTNNEEILKLLLNNQFINITPNNNNYKELFKTIRNHLSHYNYKFENNIISFYDNKLNINISFSIASLCLILLAGLSNKGQSNRINSSDSSILRTNNLPSEITVTNQIDYNEITPLELIHIIRNDLIVPLFIIIKSEITNIPNEELPIEILKRTLPDLISEYGYNIKINPINSHIREQINNYLDKYDFNINDNQYNNIYHIIIDEIKRSTISYKLFIEILYHKNNLNNFKEYLPILQNQIIIDYLNIVFCDYAYKQQNILSNEFFEYLNPNKKENIPQKLRNSLAHCHYRYQDITNSSSDIIIEFWDEQNNKINFECKIKKGKIEKLIEAYINSFK